MSELSDQYSKDFIYIECECGAGFFSYESLERHEKCYGVHYE